MKPRSFDSSAPCCSLGDDHAIKLPIEAACYGDKTR
jgi:hypothetical protein